MNNMGVYNPGPKKNIKVIALTVVCIVLAASLVGVLALYLSNGNTADLKAQITEKDNTITSLQSQITSLESQISQNPNSTVYQNQITSLNEQISSLNEQISYLNDQLSGYYNVAIMNSSSILLSQQLVTQDANSTTSIFSSAIYYAGYVTIQATASANTTFVEVNYSYAGSTFDYNKTIGTSGTAVFPVLPGTLLINIGNTNQTAANNATVSATYYY
jgi:cell division protein FtsL